MSEPRETREQAAEAAAIRRRWITLGEGLAVIGVVISALALWNSYQERAGSEAERVQAETRAGRATATLLLKAAAEHDGARLTLAPLHADQTIQGQTIAFPAALALAPVETTGNARIEADWLSEALRRARKAKQRPDESAGDERLPIAITTHFLADDRARDDTAIYELGYVAEGRLFGTRIRLKGLSLVGHVPAVQAGKRIDAMWTRR